MGKIKFSGKQKIGLGVAGGLLAGAGALAYKRLSKGKKGFSRGFSRSRKGTVTKLRNQVMKTKLRTALIKEKRKLFKEQLRV